MAKKINHTVEVGEEYTGKIAVKNYTPTAENVHNRKPDGHISHYNIIEVDGDDLYVALDLDSGDKMSVLFNRNAKVGGKDMDDVIGGLVEEQITVRVLEKPASGASVKVELVL